MPINVQSNSKHWYQCFSIKINADQCRTIWINFSQFFSVPFNADQPWSVLYWLALIFIEKHFGSIWDIDPHWSALHIDPSCPAKFRPFISIRHWARSLNQNIWRHLHAASEAVIKATGNVGNVQIYSSVYVRLNPNYIIIRSPKNLGRLENAYIRTLGHLYELQLIISKIVDHLQMLNFQRRILGCKFALGRFLPLDTPCP